MELSWLIARRLSPFTGFRRSPLVQFAAEERGCIASPSLRIEDCNGKSRERFGSRVGYDCHDCCGLLIHHGRSTGCGAGRRRIECTRSVIVSFTRSVIVSFTCGVIGPR